MIKTLNQKKGLFIPLLLSILFFLRKGIQYAMIGSFIPLLIIIGLNILLVLSILNSKKGFIIIAKIWATILILWSLIRILFSTIHLTVIPFQAFHLSQQLGAYSLVLSIIMLIFGVLIFRNLKAKRIKGWL